MAQCSYLERNHWNPADSALSTAASSVGSTARSIVHFTLQSSLCLFHLWINEETNTKHHPIKAESMKQIEGAVRRRLEMERIGR